MKLIIILINRMTKLQKDFIKSKITLECLYMLIIFDHTKKDNL